MANGYPTSIATIADDAGRTIGAVYGNYASKERLCFEYFDAAQPMRSPRYWLVTAADDDVDSRLEAIRGGGGIRARTPDAAADPQSTGLSVLRNPDQRDKTAEAINHTLDSVREMVELTCSGVAQANSAALDRAANAITALATGLSAMRGLGTVGERESTAILTEESMRMWMEHLAAPTAA